MKKTFFALMLLALLATLAAQTTTPRSWYFLLQDANGNHLPENYEGLKMTATLHGVNRDAQTPGFGFTYSNGYMMARTQLGNFGEEWEIGDILNVVITREDEPDVGALINLPIPEGSGPIWWGVPEYEGKIFPGEPIRLLPFDLLVRCDSSQKPIVYIDGEESDFPVNLENTISFLRELPKKLGLGPAPKGMRWEPAEIEVSLNDFTLQKRLDDDGSEHECYALELEFRLVED